jgi:hypothetical protein
VHVVVLPQVLRLSVGDRSPSSPNERTPEGDRLSGRGLSIVAALASRWGCAAGTDGKIVWAELPTAPTVQRLSTT